MSASVRDLLDGAQPIAATVTAAMRWLAPDSQAPCFSATTVVSGGVVTGYAPCGLVGRHDRHQPQRPTTEETL